ncbi:hypothetical protein ENKNEFLB_02821 [Nocardioides aquaticus]|uniref:Uncharacterized protein n=2 Tax=Actinomycetes TaxID=1760 RepID=A0ABP4DHL3_9ACTN|nr:hypothetical protein [Nocardioides aquaticus]QVT80426.1 hypothetical protein ENKNEFLB_02821 [Nocardioides aquaticus]
MSNRRTYTERRTYSARVMQFRKAVYADREPVEVVVEKGKRRGQVESVAMTNGARLLLLRLSDDMNANGIVSVPSGELAKHFGVAPARISEWIKAARAHRFLDPVTRPRQGHTAVYQGLNPDKRDVRESRHLDVRPGVHLTEQEHGEMYALGGSHEEAVTAPEAHIGPEASTRRRRRGREEGTQHDPVAFHLAVCAAHGDLACTSCRTDQREVS